MIKFIFIIVFIIPLSFVKGSFWLIQFFFFLLFFVFLVNFSFDYLCLNISLVFGCDLLSFMMIVLRFWICSLIILASEKLYRNNFYYNIFTFLIILLMIFLFCTFGTTNLFVFYLFFESRLIPTLILILGWGYQPERIQAGVYLLFYTMFASLPMLVSIFYVFDKFGSLDYFFFNKIDLNLIVYLCINFVFLVKIPIFFVHL